MVANTYPNLKSYDPAFAYELVVIVREGIRRMYEEQENIFYYITAYNENYVMPSLPKKKSVQDGILAGAYLFYSTESEQESQVHLLGSGSIMQQVLSAKEKLEALGYGVSIWSVTSYNELYREAEQCERDNRLHPFKKARVPFIKQLFSKTSGVTVAVSDYMKALPNSIASWMPENFTPLGTDGYGLSESRADLRDYFEISPDYICHAALVGLFRNESIDAATLKQQLKNLHVDVEKADPSLR